MALCKKFKKQIKTLVGKIDEELEKLAPVVLKITGGIRDVLAGPVGDILTAVIPGDLDNVLRQAVIKKLSAAIDYIGIVDTCKEKEGAEKVKCFIEELKKQSPALRESVLVKLGSVLLDMLHSGSLSRNEYDLFIQLNYSLNKTAA